MKNMNDFKSFKGLKTGNSLITEDVIQIGTDYSVRGFRVPVALVNSFKKKAKEAGQDITGKFADTELAEYIASYVATTYLTIENLPLEVLGADYSNIQVQPAQTQVQPQSQIQDDVQNSQAQDTVQDIPSQEDGVQTGQGQGQGQTQTQIQNPQNQTQNTQEI